MASVARRLIDVKQQPMDCSFHPSESLIAAGLITGELRLYDCSGAEPSHSLTASVHEDSCRSVSFVGNGNALLTGSADCSILHYDVVREKAQKHFEKAHKAAVNRLLATGEQTFASGDDDGVIKFWDHRQRKATCQFTSHTEFVADLTLQPNAHCLLAVSGDGTLSVNDLRTSKVRARSDADADDALEAVAVLKNGRKVVCGAQSGVLSIFSWGQFDDCSDRLPGHPSSIDAIVKLDEDTIITGGGDGVVRVLSIQPHNLLGVLGEQEEGGCDRLALSSDRRLLASTTYGTSLSLWNTSILDEDDDGEGEKPRDEATAAASSCSDEEDTALKKRSRKQEKRERKPKKVKGSRPERSNDFFKDLL